MNKDADTRTAFSKPLSAKTVQELSFSKLREAEDTRTSVEKPKFYTVSMNDNKGTVLLAARNRKAFPLAYFMDENNIDSQVLINDPSSDVTFLVNLAMSQSGSIPPEFDFFEFYQDPEYEEAFKRVFVRPKCKVWWHQEAPYNKYCFTSKGEQALAGCVAIAGAQALTVLRPELPMITSWDEVIKENPSATAQDEIAKLIKYIGDETGMNYGVDASGTRTENLVPLFERYGIKDYDSEHAQDVLMTRHGVVVVSGYEVRHG
ncbi:C10 family peptidase [Hoylesella enoeca]|uniref:C10 family peptidase n=1 Tax=Hoylesella enoeca TaxID=76123 RepID=UPI00288AACDD|nr:C10 family peptidase [Hoylesella enoeca]